MSTEVPGNEADNIMPLAGVKLRIFSGTNRFLVSHLVTGFLESSVEVNKIYDETYQKLLLYTGDDSTYQLNFPMSTDVFETSATNPTVPYTVTYMINMMQGRKVPEMQAEWMVPKTTAEDSDLVTFGFTGFVQSVRQEYNKETGYMELIISGEVKSYTAPTS